LLQIPCFSANAHLWLLALLEEFLLSLLLLVGLLPGEVLLGSYLINLLLVETGEIDLLGSGDNIAGVDSSEGNTVDLEWTSDEDDTLREVLQEDNALAAETASEEDEDGTGSESWAGSVGTDGLANLKQAVSCNSFPFHALNCEKWLINGDLGQL